MPLLKTPRILITSLAALFLSSCGKESGVPLAANTKAEQSNARGAFNAAVAAEAAGKTKRALKGYRTVTKDFPLSTSAPEASYREAALLERSGDLLDAFDAYDSYQTPRRNCSRGG